MLKTVCTLILKKQKIWKTKSKNVLDTKLYNHENTNFTPQYKIEIVPYGNK